MKKFLAIMLSAAVVLLAGCTPTQVHVCPSGGHNNQNSATAPQESGTVPQNTTHENGEVKTGMAVIGSLKDSKNASAEEAGVAKYDVTLVAVTVDDNGVIQQCIIDGIASQANFDTAGVVTTDLSTPVQTKNELGDAYGMKAYGGSKYEWNEQAGALAKYAVGKTVEELKNGAINESGNAADADLASVATIYLGGYVSAIEEAVKNAVHLGAQAGDRLVLSTANGLESSKNADAENEGVAQLDVNVTALTMNGEIITSCIIDGMQAKVSFNAAGEITSDVNAAVLTKNQLGENYGMKAWGGAIAEWNEQAASFAKYVTGKTLAEVAGIAVNEQTKPTDADLASSVTIAVGGFQALIAKAAG